VYTELHVCLCSTLMVVRDGVAPGPSPTSFLHTVHKSRNMIGAGRKRFVASYRQTER
jgi:hypothetical protein